MASFFKTTRAATGLDRQVCKQHSKVIQGEIDQTWLAIAHDPHESESFSFLVLGDTDAGMPSHSQSTADAFANAFPQQLCHQLKESRFLLHTGDVTYPTGSYQNYLNGFLHPYQSLLSHIPKSPAYNSGDAVFSRPFLPVLGNHDYASLPKGFLGLQGLRRKLVKEVCDRLRQTGIDLGHYGGEGGEAYGQTFLDDLAKLSPEQLTTHLATHYNQSVPQSSPLNPSYCLNYQPSQFTRLPNRYYGFRYGNVDFFALDSNTWNTDDCVEGFDHEQLTWLENRLTASCQTPDVVGRIIYLHHSPYTTEESRWQQPEAFWVRRHLRRLLDSVFAKVNELAILNTDKHKPLVDLVISGHAHCLEHVQTAQTGHADANMDWVVCGGSGADIRKQCKAGANILERLEKDGRSRTEVVATSHLYAGLQGHRHHRQSFHSFLKIEVRPHQVSPFIVRPYLVRQQANGWESQALAPLALNNTTKRSIQRSAAEAAYS